MSVWGSQHRGRSPRHRQLPHPLEAGAASRVRQQVNRPETQERSLKWMELRNLTLVPESLEIRERVVKTITKGVDHILPLELIQESLLDCTALHSDPIRKVHLVSREVWRMKKNVARELALRIVEELPIGW